MRSRLAELYDTEVHALTGAADNEMRKLIGLSQNSAIRLYEGCIHGGLSRPNYANKLAGYLWIIRPDERPLP